MRTRLAIGWLALLAAGLLFGAVPSAAHAGGGCEGTGPTDVRGGMLVEMQLLHA